MFLEIMVINNNKVLFGWLWLVTRADLLWKRVLLASCGWWLVLEKNTIIYSRTVEQSLSIKSKKQQRHTEQIDSYEVLHF